MPTIGISQSAHVKYLYPLAALVTAFVKPTFAKWNISCLVNTNDDKGTTV